MHILGAESLKFENTPNEVEAEMFFIAFAFLCAFGIPFFRRVVPPPPAPGEGPGLFVEPGEKACRVVAATRKRSGGEGLISRYGRKLIERSARPVGSTGVGPTLGGRAD